MPLSIPSAQPVVTHVAGIREPTRALVGEPLDFDAVLDDIAMQVEQAVQAKGSSGPPPAWAYSSVAKPRDNAGWDAGNRRFRW
jgi:hypothetical protein